MIKVPASLQEVQRLFHLPLSVGWLTDISCGVARRLNDSFVPHLVLRNLQFGITTYFDKKKMSKIWFKVRIKLGTVKYLRSER